MSKRRFISLDDIRGEKEREKKQIRYGVDRLKNDVTDCFVPTNNIFLHSSNKYMNYIGYAIAAYKTAMQFKGLFRFFRK